MEKEVVDDQEVAYELVVELLAHQFAFPVRWIETQDALLSGTDGVDRLVELGPSKVLTGMGQKTLKNKISRGERPLEPHVEFLASTQNLSDLCYEYDQVGPTEDDQGSHANDQQPAPTAATAAVVASTPSPVQAPPPVASVFIEDVPLSVEFVLRCLIARKLRRSIAEVPSTKTIKDLCNGKSTLQNELVGDFHQEFSNVPERPEDLPLKEWQMGCDISLGKVSSSLVAKLVSSKMPAKFSIDTARKHMASKWGLGPSRQSAILLYGLTAEPPSRLASHKAAEEFWDEIAGAYAGAVGITLQIQVSQAGNAATSAPTIDPSIVAGFAKANNKMAQQQMAALAEYLEIDLGKDNGKADAEILAAELQSKLDAVTSEFSEEFISGVMPVFTAKKTRRYASWWNTARQDLMAFFDNPALAEAVRDQSSLELFAHRMANRANEELVEIVQSRSRQVWDGHNYSPRICAAVDLVQQAVLCAVDQPPRALCSLPACAPMTTITDDGSIQYGEVARPGVSGAAAYAQVISRGSLNGINDKSPFVSLHTKQQGTMAVDSDLTDRLLQQTAKALEFGYSLCNKNVLVTGAGPNSIGAEVVRLLLMGGARVIVTTSREPHTTAKYFQRLYEDNGAKGSELILIQFNQASALDCERLVDYVYDTNGLNIDLDAVLPFAAAPEPGSEVADISAKNELVHRLMLANVLRLLGRIIHNKRARQIDCHPTQVLLPLSPNHGTFGGDGLYSESKLGLESLINRVQSESWAEELSVCGVKIGWTRGTGLMNVNDIVAETVEKHGVLTFSVQEMAFTIVMLMTEAFAEACENAPIMADLGGGLSALDDCASILNKAREDINLAADIAKAIKAADDEEARLTGMETKDHHRGLTATVPRKASLQIGFPRLPKYEEEMSPLRHLQGMNDLSNTVIVVGLAELGPWGSARLRWEIEKRGKLSQAGYLEMAWLMGMIKHIDGPLKDVHYVGWVDAKTSEPVADDEIEKRYGDEITQHTGIRMLEKETAGYDPKKKEFLEEIAVADDVPEFETSKAAADAMRLKHGDAVAVRQVEGSDSCLVKIKRGATILVPKAVPFDWGCVAGQLPSGWNPSRYGIPKDLIDQLDPATVFTICCVGEAFYSAGITDPLEIFKYIHLSEIGNFLGSSMGGALKTRNLYKDTYLDKAVQADMLQDTYLNTTAAWVNMLLIGSAGPIKTPVGACATGVESVDTGLESIKSGRTKMCIVGGFDDFQEEEAYGFSKMKATVNAGEELQKGRLPSEMSRPTAASRAGFVEAHGCGVQLLCRGDIALQMGLPVYGVIAASTMAADKIGRSVPAPGQGILTFARETLDAARSRSISTDPEAEPMSRSISSSTTSSRKSVSDMSDGSSGSSLVAATPATPPDTLFAGQEPIGRKLQNLPWFTTERRPTRRTTDISPLRAGLAAWGLTIDDITFASLHGTSTKANDTNEPEVICKQMAHLGRDPGLPLWAICQKSVTGHPKAPAAAWMLNGALQALDAGEIPGNRNADNVDAALRSSKYLCFPTRSVKVKDVKAFILNSFGFGQKGGQIIGVAPRFFFATLSRGTYETYSEKCTRRKQIASREFAKAIMSNAVVKIQDHPPYDEASASEILLNPLARISKDETTGSYRYKAEDLWNVNDDQSINFIDEESKRLLTQSLSRFDGSSSRKAWIERQLGTHASPRTVGIDLVQLDCFTACDNPIFIERNYTPGEQSYIRKNSDARSATASRWAAKEAVFKCLKTESKGAGAAMRDIEIISLDHEETSKVALHGDAFAAARRASLEDIQLSLTYEDGYVAAIALGVVGDGLPTYA